MVLDTGSVAVASGRHRVLRHQGGGLVMPGLRGRKCPFPGAENPSRQSQEGGFSPPGPAHLVIPPGALPFFEDPCWGFTGLWGADPQPIRLEKASTEPRGHPAPPKKGGLWAP